MKNILLPLTIAVLFAACVAPERKREVKGVYHRPWFHSDTVLSLGADGGYSLDYTTLADEGVRGAREVGVWTRTGPGVVLHPTSNTYCSGFDDLRTLDFSVQDGRRQLTPRSKDGDLRKELPFTEEPNQALLPTTTAVTPPAGQESRQP